MIDLGSRKATVFFFFLRFARTEQPPALHTATGNRVPPRGIRHDVYTPQLAAPPVAPAAIPRDPLRGSDTGWAPLQRRLESLAACIRCLADPGLARHVRAAVAADGSAAPAA